MTAVMIDRQGTIDRDDALHVQPFGDDSGWHLTVHIADVASGFTPGSSVDVEARRRGRTFYGPANTRTMLPLGVERRLTLSEHQPRATLVVQLHIAVDGTTFDIQLDRATLTDAWALTHEQVATALNDPEHPEHQMLRHAGRLAHVLLAHRRNAGALAVYDLTRGWATDDDGQLVHVDAPERNIGYVIVQEAMIAANAALATWAVTNDVPILFRNHTAAAAAPSAGDLAEDLRAAIAAGAPNAFEATRERLAMVMRPATYDATVRGHYALTLPAYTHATSPLRRYADLATQRQIFAALDGRDLPYSVLELGDLGEQVNTRERERRQLRAVLLKHRAHGSARTAAAADTFAHLTPAQFAPILKRACKDDLYSDELAAETIHRSENGALSKADQHMVLLVATDPQWAAARQAIVNRLVGTPQDAISLLAMHAAPDPTMGMSVDSIVEGPDHARTFTARAALRHGNDTYLGGPRSAPSKKLAEQLAAVRLLAHVVGVQDPSVNVLTAAPEPPAALARPKAARGQHPVSTLNEYTQTGHATDVRWDFKRTGPDHAPKYTAWVAATIAALGELNASGEAGSKAGARERAAATLLERIHSAPGRTQIQQPETSCG